MDRSFLLETVRHISRKMTSCLTPTQPTSFVPVVPFYDSVEFIDFTFYVYLVYVKCQSIDFLSNRSFHPSCNISLNFMWLRNSSISGTTFAYKRKEINMHAINFCATAPLWSVIIKLIFEGFQNGTSNYNFLLYWVDFWWNSNSCCFNK